MTKHLKLLMIALFASLSFTFTACGDDDDDPDNPNNGGTININGVNYKVSTDFITMEGEWDSYNREGHFTVSVIDKHDIWYYTFHYTSSSLPKVGDEFSQMDISLQPLDDSDVPIYQYLPYVSGSAKVTAVNKSDGTMTVKFSNLKFERNDYTYTFNGSATVSFDFD